MDLRGRLSNPAPPLLRILDRLPFDLTQAAANRLVQNEVIHRRVRRLSTDQINELVAEYEAGSTVPELVARFGIHRTTVLSHLERQGVARRPCLAKLTKNDIDEAERLYQEGRSCSFIGARFAVDPETIRRALKRAGVALRPRRGSVQ